MYTVTCTPHIRFKTERPERPEGPEEPERPEDPETPDDPENPERPERPERLEEPEKPEEPEEPEITSYSPISRRRERTSASVARKGPWASIFTVATAEAKRAASRGLSPWARR